MRESNDCLFRSHQIQSLGPETHLLGHHFRSPRPKALGTFGAGIPAAIGLQETPLLFAQRPPCLALCLMHSAVITQLLAECRAWAVTCHFSPDLCSDGEARLRDGTLPGISRCASLQCRKVRCAFGFCGTDVWRITRLPREPVLWPLQSWEGWGQHPHGESVRVEGGSGTPVSGLGPVWDGSRPRADAVISAVWLLRSDWILNPVRCLKMSIILWLGLRGPILPQ